MSCGACIKVTCAETSSLPKYLGGYSLSNGTFAQNTEAITITTQTPGGPTTVTFPPGSIQISTPTNPTSPFTFNATSGTCNASYTADVPETQSMDFSNSVIQALAQQLGDCLNKNAAASSGHGSGGSPQFVNSPQTISCPSGSQMLLCNPSLYFPQGITFDSSGNGSLTIAGGICVASTLASANQGALNLLQAFLANMINSSNMVCGGTCPVNTLQTITCSGDAQMSLCNPSLVFPTGVTFDSSENGSLSIAAGTITGATVAAANAAAVQLLQTFLNTQISSGNMYCGGPCPNCAQVLAGLIWTATNTSFTNGGTATGTGSAAAGIIAFDCAASGDSSEGPNGGQMAFETTIVNTSNTPCEYIFSLSISSSSNPCFDSQIVIEGGPAVFNYGGGESENTYPGSLTVPANSSLNLQITCAAIQAFECSDGSTLVGTMTITLA